MPKVAILTSGGIAPCLSASIGGLIEKYNRTRFQYRNYRIHAWVQRPSTWKISGFFKRSKDNYQALYDFGGSPIGNSRVKLTNIEDCVKKGFVSEGEIL